MGWSQPLLVAVILTILYGVWNFSSSILSLEWSPANVVIGMYTVLHDRWNGCFYILVGMVTVLHGRWNGHRRTWLLELSELYMVAGMVTVQHGR